MARILIAEDDPYVNELLTDILELAGHDVIRVLDGVAALGMVRMERPDLVLMDLRLPTLDGGDVIRILKSDVTVRDIPIIAVSASANLLAEAADLPVEAVVSKPFELESVLAEVTIQLIRSQNSDAVGSRATWR